jgi:predicted dehydrogenase/ABC-type cobalamin/Fe3+-siderophores transport system ATPase subunit
VLLHGREVRFGSPREAQHHGIATVHQHLAIQPLMSVTRNFFLGREPTVGWGPLKRLDMARARRIAVEQMGARWASTSAIADQAVGTLSGGERQCVAISRAVYFGAEVLILDEPTAALGVRQAAIVLRYVAQARAQGLAVIFITHNVHHAYPVADAFTILRRGSSYGTFGKAEVSREEVLRMMSGTEELDALEQELEEFAARGRRDEGASAGARARSGGRLMARRELGDRAHRQRLHGQGARARVRPRRPRLRRSARDASAAAARGSRPRHGTARRPRARLRGGQRRLARAGLPSRTSTSSTSPRPTICTPRWRWRALEAGKHVYCEKPLALDGASAAAMASAARAAGVVTMVGFNYLKSPAALAARRLIEAGVIGEVWQFRGAFQQDVLADPRQPFGWRFERSLAGSGALGDLGAHVIALALELVGEVREVCAQASTVIDERPVAQGGYGYREAAAAGAALRTVENEDAVHALVRFEGGATGVIEANRVATGRKVHLTFDVIGSRGAIAWDHERMNELLLYDAGDPADRRGFKTVIMGPEHPYYGRFWPVAGCGLGLGDTKVIEVYELLQSVAQGLPARPDFAAGAAVQRVVDAILESARQRRWVSAAEPLPP